MPLECLSGFPCVHLSLWADEHSPLAEPAQQAFRFFGNFMARIVRPPMTQSSPSDEFDGLNRYSNDITLFENTTYIKSGSQIYLPNPDPKSIQKFLVD